MADDTVFPTQTARVVTFSGHAHLAMVTAARRWVGSHARRRNVPLVAVEDLELVVTELVANAVPVSENRKVTVELEFAPGAVVVRVTDPAGGEVPTSPSLPGIEEEEGRGLVLVDALASSWKVVSAEEGKTVAARIELSRYGRVA